MQLQMQNIEPYSILNNAKLKLMQVFLDGLNLLWFKEAYQK